MASRMEKANARAPEAPNAPPFGKADLSNCEREQIQLAQSIQPHGVLLVLSEPEHVVIQASANADEFLALDRPVLGLRLTDFAPGLADCIAPHLRDTLDSIPHAVRCRLGQDIFEGFLHRAASGAQGLVIELERAGPPVAFSEHLLDSLRAIPAAATLRALCDETARIFKAVTGYDRVMVYRFDDEGHGEVFSEQREPGLEPYIGNRYPASDIPQIARRLYERNRVRVLVDVDYTPVAIVPRLSPITGSDLDMSLCVLRSMSPIHMQYLKNMGVAATLVASVVVGGKLWGLISCHHYVPRLMPFEIRAVSELLAEVFATRIAALHSFGQAQAELSVRRLEQRMIEAISREGDWRRAIFDSPRAILEPVGANGAALLIDDEVLTVGDVPGTQELREIGAWLDGRPRAHVIATASLGTEEPEFARLSSVASGVIAAPISRSPGEYLVWLRAERVKTVTWAGNPNEPFLIGSSPFELSPRRSFAQWHQLVKGTSDPWTPADLTAARLIGDTVTDVVLQFRSVRMLIAKNQFDSVTGQVGASDQPVIIADAEGQILLVNASFERLLPEGHRGVTRLRELPVLFADAGEARRRLSDLTAGAAPGGARSAWKGSRAAGGRCSSGPIRSFPRLAKCSASSSCLPT